MFYFSEQEAAAAAAAANAAHAPYNDAKENKDLIEKKVKDLDSFKDDDENVIDYKTVKSEVKQELFESSQESKIDANDERKSGECTDDDSTPPKLDIAEGALQQGDHDLDNKSDCEADTKPELDKEEDIKVERKDEKQIYEEVKAISEKENSIEGENKDKPDLKEEDDNIAKNKHDQEQNSETAKESNDGKAVIRAVKPDHEDSKIGGKSGAAADEKSFQNDVEDTKKSLVKAEVGSTADTDIELDRADVMSQDSTTTNTPNNNNCGAMNNDDAMSQSSFSFDLDGPEPTVAQLIHTTTTNSNSVRWPKVCITFCLFISFCCKSLFLRCF